MKTEPPSRPSRPAFLGEMFEQLTERGRRLLGRREGAAEPVQAPELSELADLLLSRRGEASGVALARGLLSAFEQADSRARLAFLLALADRFGPDPAAVEAAVAAFQADPASPTAMEALHTAAEPRRQELLRRLNLAPGGTAALVRIREELLRHLRDSSDLTRPDLTRPDLMRPDLMRPDLMRPDLTRPDLMRPDLMRVDGDFAHLFGSWFNRGFLVLRHIDWTTPANILAKIIRYEAVHAIQNWDDLRNRLEPTDRRCYAFFHPQLVDEPLIFVEVALTEGIPDNVAFLLDLKRQSIEGERASTAVFYSISNTQRGLAGVSFGNFLIKQVVEELKAELPDIRTFVTLSPVPGFAAWLARQRKDAESNLLTATDSETFAMLDAPDWHLDPARTEALRSPLMAAAATYFLRARDGRGRVIDPVARFHLGNGARLEQLDFLGDVSANGLRQSHGLMVNYLYDPDRIEANHEGFAERNAVAASDRVKRALPAPLT